jgi:hypothetical protein
MSAHPAGAAFGPSRWDGSPGRLEVWYVTLTDPATGTGAWFHVELVAPEGGGDPHLLGWAAVFPTDTEPVIERFGPEPVQDLVGVGDDWVTSAGMRVGDGVLAGQVGEIAYDLTWADDSPPLWTFPKAVWERELLPAAQALPAPAATFTGTLTVGGRRLEVDGARGGVARIYGHGNAQRWAWLHADLGGGDVCELVTAVSRRPGLNKLWPATFLQMRRGGQDWPRRPEVFALGLRGRIDLPAWSVSGLVGRRRVRIAVSQPPERCVDVAYADPDGAPATCTNTELADAEILIERWAGRWHVERHWSLAGTAHAEVGHRP